MPHLKGSIFSLFHYFIEIIKKNLPEPPIWLWHGKLCPSPHQARSLQVPLYHCQWAADLLCTGYSFRQTRVWGHQISYCNNLPLSLQFLYSPKNEHSLITLIEQKYNIINSSTFNNLTGSFTFLGHLSGCILTS